MNAIVKADGTPAVRDQATSLIEVISRAASDPSIDIDKLERLMAMHERMTAKQAEAAFSDAMSLAQTEMRPISADAENPQTHSNYASYGQLDKALRPIYTKHGFSLSFSDGETAKPDHVRVLAVVRHKGGHKETHWKDMPADGKGAKGGDVMTKTHAAGAAQTYGMRYLLKGIFNVAIGEDDKDGNETEETISEQQAADLGALCTEVGADPVKFRKLFCKVDSFDQILAKNYDFCVTELRRYGREKQAKQK